MESTGIIRRVDNLGRVVIPMEIRKKLKIRDGDELEILFDNSGLYLRKFSKISELSNILIVACNVVSNVLGKSVLISDKNAYIFGCGCLWKKYFNKNISSFFENLMDNRIIKVEKTIHNINIVDATLDKFSYIFYPIIVNGDVIGSLLVLSENNNISDFDVKICEILVMFLNKYIEE